MESKCEVCGSMFNKKSKKIRFCSQKCGNVGRKKKDKTFVDVTCPQCGIIHKRTLSNGKPTNTFCSVSCARKSKAAKPIDALSKYQVITSSNECYGWNGSYDAYGYGRVSINGKWLKAHRVSYEINKGEIPKGLIICHTCNNRECTNPNHLYAGTQKNNNDDTIKSGRRKYKQFAIHVKDWNTVINMRSIGMSQSQIGMVFGVSQSAVGRLIRSFLNAPT